VGSSGFERECELSWSMSYAQGWSGVEPLLAELEEASIVETEAIKLVRGEAVLVCHLNKRLLLSLFAKSFNEWYHGEPSMRR